MEKSIFIPNNTFPPKKASNKYIAKCSVHIYTDKSSAHTKRVIVNYSHGHLFSPDDIIMEIPMQGRTIFMSPYIVKVGAQV